MNLLPNRLLEVDLRSTVVGDDWDELLDAIIRELALVGRVRFIVPTLGHEQEALLSTLEYILTKRGVAVERESGTEDSGRHLDPGSDR